MAQGRAQRFEAPKGCQGDCKEIVVKELDGDDEIEAAVWADEKAGQPGFKSLGAYYKLERTEKIRAAIVAVDGKLVNVPGRPFKGYDKFHAPTKIWISACFDKLNSLESKDLEKSLAAGKEVDLEKMLSGGAASTDEPTDG